VPPAETARFISATMRAGSGTKFSTSPDTAASCSPSLPGSACASPILKVTRGSVTRARAYARYSSDRFDADDRARRAPRDDGLGEGAGAAADVEPAQVVGNPSQPTKSRATSRLQRPT